LLSRPLLEKRSNALKATPSRLNATRMNFKGNYALDLASEM
jgi:hypothetical protein